jgi:hypothetical protein
MTVGLTPSEISGLLTEKMSKLGFKEYIAYSFD